MEDAGRNFVKWTLAIIVLAGIVAYALQEVGNALRAGIALGDSEESEEEGGASDATDTPLPSGPVTSGETRAETDLALVAGVVRGKDADAMVVGPGPGDAAVVSFPLIPGDPNCVEAAEVIMGAREITPTELALHPSALWDLAALADDTTTPVDPVIPTPQPPVVVAASGPVVLSWNVTEMYRTWVTGGSFGDVAAPPIGTPFTVVVKPILPEEPERRVVLGTTEAADPPLLRWTGIPGCGAQPPAEG